MLFHRISVPSSPGSFCTLVPRLFLVAKRRNEPGDKARISFDYTVSNCVWIVTKWEREREKDITSDTACAWENIPLSDCTEIPDIPQQPECTSATPVNAQRTISCRLSKTHDVHFPFTFCAETLHGFTKALFICGLYNYYHVQHTWVRLQYTCSCTGVCEGKKLWMENLCLPYRIVTIRLGLMV